MDVRTPAHSTRLKKKKRKRTQFIAFNISDDIPPHYTHNDTTYKYINGIFQHGFYSFHMQNAIIERHKDICRCVGIHVCRATAAAAAVAVFQHANNSVDESYSNALGLEWKYRGREREKKNSAS